MENEDLVECAHPTKISDVPDDQALALFDLDGTLTIPGSELLIQKFVIDVQVGAAETREELKNRFKKWKADLEKGANPDYQQYLTDVGDLWARLLSRDGYNPTQSELLQVTGNWFAKKGRLEVKDYAKGVIDSVKSRSMRPILVTGAPWEIATHFAGHLGIEHAFAMEVAVDDQNRFIDVVRHNTGLANAKLAVCDRLRGAGRKILFAMGDTHADSELWYSAIYPDDDNIAGVHGRAVLINPRPETLAECKRWNAGLLSRKKLTVIEQHTPKMEVINGVRLSLDAALKQNGMKNGNIEKAAA